MDQYKAKLFLLLSHLFFLFPLIYLATRKRWDIAGPFLLVLATATTSSLYHACDNPMGDNINDLYLYYCALPFSVLYGIDFQMSALTAANICSYSMSIKFVFIRELAIVSTFLFTSYAYGYYDTDNTIVFYVCIVMVNLIVVVSRAYSRKIEQLQCKRFWLPLEANTKYGIISGLCFFAGFMCFIFDDDDANEYYYVIHAFWHIMMAMGLLFGFIWIDSFHYEEDVLLFNDVYATYLPTVRFHVKKDRTIVLPNQITNSSF